MIPNFEPQYMYSVSETWESIKVPIHTTGLVFTLMQEVLGSIPQLEYQFERKICIILADLLIIQ